VVLVPLAGLDHRAEVIHVMLFRGLPVYLFALEMVGDFINDLYTRLCVLPVLNH
jgi:hypothetical protein